MSLFAPPSHQPDNAQVTRNLLRETASGLFHQLRNAHAQALRHVWSNQFGLTPQEVCDALGTDAVKFFRIHGELTDFLVKAAAIDGTSFSPPLPPKAFTLNEDGTVTILDEPYVPPAP